MKHRNRGASIILAALLAIPLFGRIDPADAQGAIQLSHESAVLSDCQDLMNRIRQQYGRAPVCLKVTVPGGQSLTELSGLVSLSDDMTNPWYEMRITTDPVDPTRYRYDTSDINNVITMIQYSRRGLTDEQVSQVVTSKACSETESKLKAERDAGALTEQQYQLAISDVRKTIKGCTQ
jgi:hypothetical protein